MTNNINKSFNTFFRSSIIVIACLFFLHTSFAQYQLKIKLADKDTSFNLQSLKLTTNFANNLACATYVNQLPEMLHAKGYALASVDSIRYEASYATMQLYIGKQFRNIKLHINTDDRKLLSVIGNADRSIDVLQTQSLQQRILNYYENNGYPFASTSLDSIRFNEEMMSAKLTIDKGVLYHIDSIRLYGKAKISNIFLQQYLGIKNSSIYSKEKLQQVSKRLLNLPYLQEQQSSDITLLGTGSILNLYLQPKPTSQINFLVGFLPADNQTGKLRLTGDVNLNLKNVLAHGETLLLNWQQLQTKSPRLNIGFQQPYIFKSPFGIDFSFNLFKKDSTFLQLNAQLGLQYLLSANQSGKIFFQQQSTVLLSSGVDTNLVKATKQLPVNIDVSAVNIGVDYEWSNTNYQYNPIKGNELKLVAAVGIKNIKKNNDVVSLKDPIFNYETLYDSLQLKTYQFRVKVTGAHFFPLGKLSTLKASVNAGFYSSQNIFKNELFQIGGYKILRGFDEESIYATQYGVATAEYRYLLGLNSYLFAFVDAGWVKNQYQSVNVNNNFIASGAGLAFETKLGLLNVSFAVGKRNDVKLDLRQAAKIHFGYINYF